MNRPTASEVQLLTKGARIPPFVIRGLMSGVVADEASGVVVDAGGVIVVDGERRCTR